jgi:hypothetical protein
VSDRLTELQRQRALAQEQLAWLDREIARETSQAATAAVIPPAPPVPVPTALTSAPVQPDMPAATAQAADEIIARYQHEAGTGAQDVKRGCYLYFFVALGLLVVGTLAAYFLIGFVRGR